MIGHPERRLAMLMPYHISERVGGAEAQAWLLARELARRGWAVTYVCRSTTGRGGEVEERDGVTIRWVRPVPRFAWADVRRYRRALEEARPTHLFVRSSSALVGVAGTYARRHGLPFAWACTDQWSGARWRSLRHVQRQRQSSRFGPVRYALATFNGFMQDLLRHGGMSGVTHAFTQNGEQEALVRRSFGLKSRRLPSGHEAPAGIEPGANFGARLVLWAGNLGANKRPELFLDLARRLAHTDLRFVMLGGKDGAGRYLARLFAERPDNLEWPGRVPFEESLRWFGRATFFVNTSRAEGFPNTFVQAWLRGVPTLSLGADPDGIVAREGLGAVARSPEGLAEALERLAADETAYRAASERALTYARRHHTVARAADRFLEVLCGNGDAR